MHANLNRVYMYSPPRFPSHLSICLIHQASRHNFHRISSLFKKGGWGGGGWSIMKCNNTEMPDNQQDLSVSLPPDPLTWYRLFLLLNRNLFLASALGIASTNIFSAEKQPQNTARGCPVCLGQHLKHVICRDLLLAVIGSLHSSSSASQH